MERKQDENQMIILSVLSVIYRYNATPKKNNGFIQISKKIIIKIHIPPMNSSNSEIGSRVILPLAVL